MLKLKLKPSEARSFIYLLIAAVFGNLCVIPMAFYVASKNLSEHLPKTLLITALNAFIIYGLILYLSALMNRNSPISAMPLLDKTRKFKLKAELIPSMTIAGVLICALAGLSQFFSWVDPSCARLGQAQIPVLFGLLASFYGGINEEILCRYFLLSAINAPFKRSKHFQFVITLGVIITAILFGLGHLPATAKFLPVESIAQLPAWVIVRSIVLNGLAGIVLGWIYIKRGLERAMLTHFLIDALSKSIEGLVLVFK